MPFRDHACHWQVEKEAKKSQKEKKDLEDELQKEQQKAKGLEQAKSYWKQKSDAKDCVLKSILQFVQSAQNGEHVQQNAFDKALAQAHEVLKNSDIEGKKWVSPGCIPDLCGWIYSSFVLQFVHLISHFIEEKLVNSGCAYLFLAMCRGPYCV